MVDGLAVWTHTWVTQAGPAGGSVRDVGDLVASEMFGVGLAYGGLAFLLSALLAVFRRGFDGGGGVAFGAAVALAIRDVYGHDTAPLDFLGALVVVGAGGWLAVRIRPRSWRRWYVAYGRNVAALLPGAALMLVTFPLASPTWVRVVAALATALVGASVLDFDRVQGAKGAPFVLLAIAALSVYLNVPDTELPLVMLGASLPLILLSFPSPLRALGPLGAPLVVAVYAWATAVGARGRPGAFVACIAALGLLAVEPIARRIPRSNLHLGRRKKRAAREHEDRWWVVVLVAGLAQLALAVYCSQVAGREENMAAALLASAPALALLVGASPALLPTAETRMQRVHPRPRRHRRSPVHIR